MEMWMVFAALAVVCLIVGMLVSPAAAIFGKAAPRLTAPGLLGAGAVEAQAGPLVQRPQSAVQLFDMIGNLPLLTEWNESALITQLQQLRDQRPALIPHFVQSVTERLILRQDDRTAQLRLRFLRTQIEQLKLAKEFQQQINDLSFLPLEQAKRLKTIELEIQKLDLQKETTDVLERKRTELEVKKVDLEIARLNKEMAELNAAPVKAEPQLTPEQRKAKDKTECEARIASLKAEKQQALKLTDEHERVLRVNAIDDALQREYERWAKLL